MRTVGDAGPYGRLTEALHLKNLPEGRWGIVSAGRGDNPSVTLRVPPPFTQGRLLRTADDRPYTCPTEALCMRTVGDAGPYGCLTENKYKK